MVDMDRHQEADLGPVTASPTQYIGGFTWEQINTNLFPRHPTKDQETLVACMTPKGWMYFEQVPGEPGNFREHGDYNKWAARRLRAINDAVDIEFVDAPNEVKRVKSWRPKWS